MANPYIIAELILNLVDLGMRREVIRTKMKEAELAGKNTSQITEMLRAMESQAIAEAQDAIDAKLRP